MNRILFDLRACQPLGHIKFHGGGTYGYVLFLKLLEVAPEQIVAYVDTRRFLDPKVKKTMEEVNVPSFDSNLCSIEDALKESKATLFYSPLYLDCYKELKIDKIPFFITIHGMRKLEMNCDSAEIFYAKGFCSSLIAVVKQTPLYRFLERRYYRQYCRFFQKENLHVITVSEHSKYSLEYFYPSLENKIDVFYSPSTEYGDYSLVKPKINEKYYLVISADRWLKNAYRAIKAFETIFDSAKQFSGKVVVVGLTKNHRLKKVKHKQNYIFMEYVDRSMLESLMRGAYALIYPSLNEGFGYPPLEAMKYGVPVITSAFSAIPEICDNAVLYTNPYSSKEIAMRILQLDNRILYDRKSRLSLQQYEKIKRRQTDDLNLLATKLLEYND